VERSASQVIVADPLPLHRPAQTMATDQNQKIIENLVSSALRFAEDKKGI
jgi:hypothetical protein